jgi:hypothetical protein
VPNLHIALCTLCSGPAPCDTLCRAVLYLSFPTGVRVNPLIHLQTPDQTENQQQEIMNQITVIKCYLITYNKHHLCYIIKQFAYSHAHCIQNAGIQKIYLSAHVTQSQN